MADEKKSQGLDEQGEEKAQRIIDKYSAELGESATGTREYKIFKKGIKGVREGMFEKMAHFSGKILPMSVSPKEKKEVGIILQALGSSVTPAEINSLSILVVLIGLIAGIIAVLIIGPLGLLLIFAGLGGLFFVKTYPKRLVEIRRIQASRELMLSILYLVIYLRNVSNLEAAVKFAAENLTGPLADDFTKLLWDTESREYASIQEALDKYIMRWKDFSPSFVDAVRLVETSLLQISEEKRIEMLDRAVDRVLSGISEDMVRYANNLRGPVSFLYMFGIMLPVLGLVMFPLIGSFMGELVSSDMLIFFYDIILPAVVLILGINILQKRPAGFPTPDISLHPDLPPPNKFFFKSQGKKTLIPSYLPAVFPPIICILAILPYFFSRNLPIPNEFDVYMTMIPVLGVALGVIVYSYLDTFQRMKIRKSIGEIERNFSDAIFQLGSRIAEGYPTEIALIKVAAVMKGTEVANFFNRIVGNIQKLGYDIKGAIFDPKAGAIRYYPSSLVRSVMNILVKGAEKSAEVAALSMMEISSYLKDVHSIEEKMRDVLAETLGDMKMQATFLAPLISGIVVGLTSMIILILASLGEQIGGLDSGAGGVGPTAGLGGAWMMGMFSVSSSIPLYIFQPMVGIYLVEIVICLVYLISQIEQGSDMIYFKNMVFKTLTISIMMYLLIAGITTVMFTGLASMAVVVGAFG